MHAHHTIGYTMLGAGVVIGLLALIWWVGDQIDKARERAARQEFRTAAAALPRYHDGDTYEWPYDEQGYPLPYWDQGYDDAPAPRPGYEFEPPTRWDTAPWPAAGQATQHFFGTDIVRYDPEADAAEFMRRQEAETTAFIARMTGQIERVPALRSSPVRTLRRVRHGEAAPFSPP